MPNARITAERMLPASYRRLAAATYEPRPIALRPTIPGGETAYPAKSGLHLYGDRYVDFVNDRSPDSAKPGDMVEDGLRESLSNRPVLCLVEGLAKNSYGEYRYFGRVISKEGGFEDPVTFHDLYSRVKAVQKWGEYDPNEWFGKGLSEARAAIGKAKADPPDIPLAFIGLARTILAAETTDLLRRVNKLFPLRDLPRLENELAGCASPQEALDINLKLFGDFQNLLQNTYSRDSIEKILTVIAANRERDESHIEDTMRAAFDWIRSSIQYKTGLPMKKDPSEIKCLDNLSDAVNKMIGELAEYLAPLYDSSNTGTAALLYADRPVYFTALLESCADPITAAQHLVGRAVNAITELFDRKYRYDHRFETDQSLRRYDESNDKISHKIWLSGRGEHMLGLIPRLADLFDRYERKIKALSEQKLFITRTMPIQDAMRVFPENAEALTECSERFLAELTGMLGKNIEEAGGDLPRDFYEQELGSIRRVIEETKKESVRRKASVDLVQMAVRAFFKSPELDKYILAPGEGPLDYLGFLKYRLTENLAYKIKKAANEGESETEASKAVNYLGRPLLKKIIQEVNEGRGNDPSRKQLLMYHDRDFYSVYPFAPPASSFGHVLRLEISTGCDWHKCTYCSLYEKEDFSLLRFGRFRDHFEMIREYMGARDFMRYRRVFLSGGNGLVMPNSELTLILEYINKFRAGFKSGKIERIDSYATTRAILQQGKDGLVNLRTHGLDLVYWGVESGSDEVLALVNKGYDSAQVLEAGRILREAGIEASVTVMPGLGGTKYLARHEEQTARLAAEIYPKFLTFMGVYAPDSDYDKMMKGSADNRHLTNEEMAAHITKMRERYIELAKANPRYAYRKAKVAAHNPTVTPAAFNPSDFESYF